MPPLNTAEPATKALAADFVPEQFRASGVGWYNSTIGLVQLQASIVAGLLWDNIGHAVVFLYGAAFAMVGMVALATLIPARADSQPHDSTYAAR